ncbi:hypothetical protein BH10PSE9_BH10PSE9_05060 [soil metagenome]
MIARLKAGIAALLVALVFAGVPAEVGFGQPVYPPGYIQQRPPPGYYYYQPQQRPPPSYYRVQPQVQRQVAPPQGGGFFDMLFGGPRVVPPPQQYPRTITRRARPAPEDATPVVEVTAKDAKARKILVIGDFIAGGLAWGLDQTFANEAKLSVTDESENSSGLVRDDYFDWNGQLPALLNKEKPDIVVVQLGTNDRQQLRDGKNRYAPHTTAWEQAYVKRITGVVDTLKVFGRPFYWVSAPPMRDQSSSRDMAYLNDFYKPPVTAAGGHFLDIWNGFTDDNGNYISSGPDVEGQLRALRTGDGINFTRAGRLKLAFYVAREIRKSTGIGTAGSDLIASVTQQSQIEIGKDGVKRLVGPVISLTDPLPGASDVLAGATTKPPAAPADSPQTLLIVKGTALPSVAGRADDFVWPPRRAPVVAAPVAAAAPAPAPVVGKAAATTPPGSGSRSLRSN